MLSRPLELRVPTGRGDGRLRSSGGRDDEADDGSLDRVGSALNHVREAVQQYVGSYPEGYAEDRQARLARMVDRLKDNCVSCEDLVQRLRAADPTDAMDTVTMAVEKAFEELQRAFRQSSFLQKLEGAPLHAACPPILVGMILGVVWVAFTQFSISPIALPYQLAFHWSSAMAAISYHQGVVVDPGFVPEDWQGEPAGLPAFMYENSERSFRPLERKKNGAYRYCQKEEKFKPDRAHFCKHMERNVLKMDHYCPWMLNCVGHRNYKFFYLFLLYSTVAVGVAVPHMWYQVILGSSVLHPTVMNTFMLTQGAAVGSLLTCTVGPFFAFHTWLLAQNMTTIEFCEQQSSGESFKKLYDRGILLNFKSVLGKNPLLWLLPVGRPMGTGLTWDDAAETEEGAEDLEPDELQMLLQSSVVVGAMRALKEISEDCRSFGVRVSRHTYLHIEHGRQDIAQRWPTIKSSFNALEEGAPRIQQVTAQVGKTVASQLQKLPVAETSTKLAAGWETLKATHASQQLAAQWGRLPDLWQRGGSPSYSSVETRTSEPAAKTIVTTVMQHRKRQSQDQVVD
eukprot:TRINITY_DN79990_c0_g1_i1.p1 TRINITY_DN79990_c0_g1~~TRINITY_DN79990_c0_g1_i1.p1  ORF type:complete len:567 (+),score=107.03 TRINITY_DN79990_c0_g1_i1:95-1795(+)